MKSFYHYMMKYRHNKEGDPIGELARGAYQDHSFPKSSTDYHEISSYLEMNGHYLESMSVFDQAWDMYKNEQ
ncbi:MAG TPA: YozE family protein [Bacillus sp. (in: firmicutes)]|nr:YozE family protein [Bacillus sp. (in: firmicutes)]